MKGLNIKTSKLTGPSAIIHVQFDYTKGMWNPIEDLRKRFFKSTPLIDELCGSIIWTRERASLVRLIFFSNTKRNVRCDCWCEQCYSNQWFSFGKMSQPYHRGSQIQELPGKIISSRTKNVTKINGRLVLILIQHLKFFTIIRMVTVAIVFIHRFGI